MNKEKRRVIYVDAGHNDNKESFENNIAALLKLIDMYYKLKDL